MSDLSILLDNVLVLENNFTLEVITYDTNVRKKKNDEKSDAAHETAKTIYKQEYLERLREYVVNDNVYTYNVFEDMNNSKYDTLVFASFLVHYVLTKPFYTEAKVLLNNLIFDGKHDIIKSFITNFSIIWTYYNEGEIKNLLGIDKSSMEQMKKMYERYFRIKEIFDSNEITKLSEYSNSIDEFIRMQPVEILQKYITNLNGVYTGLYSEKTESTASSMKDRLTNLIVGELDNFFRATKLDNNKIAYIARYISLDDIFFPFIASYTETEFVELEKKIKGTTLEKLFNDQVTRARTKYITNHDLYLTKVESKIKDIQNKLSIDDYGIAKQLLTNANKLTKELQTSYTRFLQIANVYDETRKDAFKTKLKEQITTLQILFKKIVEKEAFLKDKEFNSKQKKDHQFTLGIELLTNVQGNEKLKYTPNMTVPSGGGDDIYFTPKRAMHQNVIKNIPPGKPPEYKYIQLTKLPDFNSLVTRLSSGYFLEADTPFDEYSKVYKKKNDELTTNNIEIVLNTLFDTGSPFYIGSDRYTSFSYGWENGVEKITKNDKKETYGDDDDSVVKGLTGPNGIQWKNFIPNVSFGSTGPLSRPPLGSIFESELDEVGETMPSATTTTTTTTAPLIRAAIDMDRSEVLEVGALGTPTTTAPLINSLASGVDRSEVSEVGTLGTTTTTAPLINSLASGVDRSEVLEVGETIPSATTTPAPLINSLASGVDRSEVVEVGTLGTATTSVAATSTITPSLVVNPSVVFEKPLITVNNDEKNEAQNGDIEAINLGYAGKPGSSAPIVADEKPLTYSPPTIDQSEVNEVLSIGASKASEVVNPLSIVANSEKPLTYSPPTIDQSEVNEVLSIGASKASDIIPSEVVNPLSIIANSEKPIPIVAISEKPLTYSPPSINQSEVNEVLGLPSKSVADSKDDVAVSATAKSVADSKDDVDVSATAMSVADSKDDVAVSAKSDDGAEEKEDKSTNIDRRRNAEYMKNLMAKGSQADKENQTKFLKLIRLEQLQDVNAFDFTSFLETPPIKGGGQVGGANALYIDIDQETTLYSQKKKELENEIKKQQEDELALLSKQNEDLNKDETLQQVKWKYFITVELHLYPGDHIPLSAYASLACSKKSNDIYNIWQNIITKIKNPDSKEKYKKKMLAYVPVNSNNKTVKNTVTAEPKNNTVKARTSSSADVSGSKATP
jgi:hypothetical protein